MYLENINRETANLYKGVGILLIVMHNFFHNVPPVIGENEFLFQHVVTDRFVAAMSESPAEWVRAVFSYLGHYGVQLFIFLSAYGLTKRYAGASLSYRQFLRSRFTKIYLSFVVCVAVYIVLGLLKSAYLTDEKVLYWDSLLWKLLLISNVIPGQALMPVGPWWFMPFIFQFYLLYPLLLMVSLRFGVIFLLVIAVASMAVEWACNPFLVRYGVNVNFMFVGHLPVLCAGIYFAIRPHIMISYAAVVVALPVFIWGCYNATVWLVADLSMTIILLVVLGWCFRRLPMTGLACRVTGFFGLISFYLFMVNGFLRTPFHLLAVSMDRWWFTIICGFMSLLFSTAFALALMRLDDKVRRLVGI